MRFLTQRGIIRMVKITITNFKQNTNNRRFDILIEREDYLPICPVQAMVDYCKLRGSEAGLLFCQADSSPITVGQFNAELRRCLLFLRVLVFALARPKRGSLTLKFGRLAAGNPMHLNYILGPTLHAYSEHR